MKRKMFAVVLLCIVGLMMSALESVADSPSGGRVAGEISAGVVGGIGGGVGGHLVMYELGMTSDITRDRIPQLFWGVEGIMVGIGLVSSIGVYLAGNIGSNETGSFPATLGGGILGALIAGGIPFGGCLYNYSTSVPSGGDETFPIEMLVIMGEYGCMVTGVLGATIGATIGFNKTRRYKSLDTSDTSAAPPIYFNLLRVRF